MDLAVVPDTWTGLPPHPPARPARRDAYGNLYNADGSGYSTAQFFADQMRLGLVTHDEAREREGLARRRWMVDSMLAAIVVRPGPLCLVTGV